MTSEVDMPGEGSIRIDRDKGKVRVLDVDGFLDGKVLKSFNGAIDLSQSDEDVAEEVYEKIVSPGNAFCPFCSEIKDESECRTYTFAGIICKHCWENCPECGNDEWSHTSSRSARKDNYKRCTECGKKLITQVATG